MTACRAGDVAKVRSTGSPVTVEASSSQGYVLVRTRFGNLWTYRMDELELRPGAVCNI